MSTVIRLTRRGRRNAAFFRIGVYDAMTRRDGRTIENLGYYNPLAQGDGPKFEINLERAQYWLSVGAQPSPTVRSFLERSEVKVSTADKRRARNQKRSQKRLAAEKKTGKLHGKAKRKANAAKKAEKAS